MTDLKRIEDINTLIAYSGVDTNKISDGYHTFGELYDHRSALFIALCHAGVIRDIQGDTVFGNVPVWKSLRHSDGTMYQGWFIAGIGAKKGDQISYHLPMRYWDKLQVAEVSQAPEFDGHTSQDVIERLLSL